jgi:hypothetical protein
MKVNGVCPIRVITSSITCRIIHHFLPITFSATFIYQKNAVLGYKCAGPGSLIRIRPKAFGEGWISGRTPDGDWWGAKLVNKNKKKRS